MKKNIYYTINGAKSIATKDFWFRLNNTGLFESVEKAESWFHAMKDVEADYLSQFVKFRITKRIIIDETVKEL